jgi:hypothetical protein
MQFVGYHQRIPKEEIIRRPDLKEYVEVVVKRELFRAFEAVIQGETQYVFEASYEWATLREGGWPPGSMKVFQGTIAWETLEEYKERQRRQFRVV